MTRYLLDTHTLLWYILGDKRLSATAQDVFADAGNRPFVSKVSLWEIAIKVNIDRLSLPTRSTSCFPTSLM